ncbi:MAG: serine/threonine protein kinase [Anaerolineales bacterium]|nr:serine/threonine protein kinase [Anaerolineales bacterium]
MKILIKNQEYELQDIGKFGREGEIYSIKGYSSSKLAKIYDDERRTAYTERKVTAIINKFRSLHWGGLEDFVAFPEFPIYEAESRKFCGFLMKNFSVHSDLFDNRYDLRRSVFKNEKLDDSMAVSVVVTLFTFLQALHKAGFILGDINPDNILLEAESFVPVLIDFDSIQLGTFYSNTNRQAYIDTSVRADGYGSKRHFIYTTDSDIYALAIVCYEFIIGIHPYFFQTSIPTDTEFKKARELSMLDYVENNVSKTSGFGFNIFENPAYWAALHRLQKIKDSHKELYKFFREVFVENRRKYFSTKESKYYKLGTKEIDLEDDVQAGDLLPTTKEDPDELELFMKQFGLSL